MASDDAEHVVAAGNHTVPDIVNFNLERTIYGYCTAMLQP